MRRIVLDASATLTWCFEDEATPWGDALLADLKAGGEATVPAHWRIEVANALLIAIRRGRISKEKAIKFIDDLLVLPIHIDRESGESAFGPTFVLAQQYNLTVYDAAYLEVAIREGLPLATLDDDLKRAARAAGISLA